MKLLYFSSDDREVAQVGKEFTEAGIPCELRYGDRLSIVHHPPCTELWIRNDRDCHRALMLCVQLGIGFARRAPRKSFIGSWSEISTGSAPIPDGSEDGAPIDHPEMTEEHPEDRVHRSRAA